MNQLNLPIEYQIWGIEQIAEYFGYSLDYTKKHVIKAPNFPPVRPLPTDKFGERIVDRWAALDVIAYALAEDKSALIYPVKKLN